MAGGASPYLATVDKLRAWMHGQLRSEQLDEVLLAVAGVAVEGTGRSGTKAVFFIAMAVRIDGRYMGWTDSEHC